MARWRLVSSWEANDLEIDITFKSWKDTIITNLAWCWRNSGLNVCVVIGRCKSLHDLSSRQLVYFQNNTRIFDNLVKTYGMAGIIIRILGNRRGK
jgi:hypothetical protein